MYDIATSQTSVMMIWYDGASGDSYAYCQVIQIINENVENKLKMLFSHKLTSGVSYCTEQDPF